MSRAPRGGFIRPALAYLKNQEPAVAVGGATAVVVAILQLLVAFGVNVDTEQQAAIVGVVAVVSPIVQGIVTRSAVFAPDTVEDIKARHRAEG